MTIIKNSFTMPYFSGWKDLSQIRLTSLKRSLVPKDHQWILWRSVVSGRSIPSLSSLSPLISSSFLSFMTFLHWRRRGRVSPWLRPFPSSHVPPPYSLLCPLILIRVTRTHHSLPSPFLPLCILVSVSFSVLYSYSLSHQLSPIMLRSVYLYFPNWLP